MLGKILSSLFSGSSTPTQPPYSPYPDASINAIYNLIFCDIPQSFKPPPGSPAAPWQSVLFAEHPKPRALYQLATDATQESRVRFLAYSRLREQEDISLPSTLLGVIIEIGLGKGLDTLAVYTDGSARYINQSGKTLILEKKPELQAQIQDLLDSASTILKNIGPWDGARRPPPKKGHVRLSFLVSDGLYFGEGPLSAMQRDPMAAPLLQKASTLLQRIVSMATQ